MFNNWPQMTVEQAAVERIRLHVQQCLSLHGWNSETYLAARCDELRKLMVLRLEAILAGKTEVLDEHTVSWPNTWWDAFKLAWFPPWALRRWPVKLHTVKLPHVRLHVCPHLPPPRERVGHFDFLRQAGG